MIQSTALAGPSVMHGFFTRCGGASEGIYASLNVGMGSGDDQDRVRENRRRIAGRLGVSLDNLVSPYQIHSPDVLTIRGPWTGDEDRKADALVTDRPGVAIAVSTADCGPVLLADHDAGVIGAAHAGWKGAIGGVLENTVAAMEALGADRSQIVAVLGPTISQSSYEVGPEFHDRFSADSSANTVFFRPSSRSGHHLFDLPGFILDRLRRSGVSHVEDVGLCTYRDEDRFYSYRRTTHRAEPDYGRLLSAIVLTAG
ncbi:MAG: peptidoglycan editing factor PgeF [Roseibium sp.]|nr:peptidoglycan editing factor PgeF [Roseibium sp.]